MGIVTRTGGTIAFFGMSRCCDDLDGALTLVVVTNVSR